MDIYIGLDISLADTHICIVDQDGAILEETVSETEPSAIFTAVEGYQGYIKRVGLEASSLGSWLHDELSSFDLPVIVVDARHMRASLEAQRNKTDKNDARGIAQMMRMGWYCPVHVKSPESQRLRVLLNNRRTLKRKLVDMENHIRGTLRAFGLKMGKIARGAFEDRARELMDGHEPELMFYIDTMLAVRNNLLEGYSRLHKCVLEIVKSDPVCRRFMTVPGVGPIAALSFRAAIDDPCRFKSSRTVGAYLGLTNRRWQSGTIDREGRITKQGDREVRTALCEAAASLLLRSQKWTAVKAWGLRLAKRTSMMNAIVAVARKLAVILHRMWLDGSTFRTGRGAKLVGRMHLTPPRMVKQAAQEMAREMAEKTARRGHKPQPA
ncbi:IS110 family transposase [Emcibacter nanhaiensis]|uniref:IS110 family transposase n=1 Tax=Emcibacter nanhaiensis TaxID=1505037 RepID=A0A501PH62_9PROT|nr:IS110 family transposase [Emcibacter nanhaiensis]TPD59341.1 IS110 family transposase [Emcibacter nanhaiensis]